MNKDDEEEFRGIVAALAQEYGASKRDVIAAAKRVPARRGRPRIDDSAALDEAMKMRREGCAANNWQAASSLPARYPGQSGNATARRLYRKLASPVLHGKPNPLGAGSEPPKRMPHPLDEVAARARDRRVNRLIGAKWKNRFVQKSSGIK